MEMPNVENVLSDPSNKVTYRVLAYRALSRQELLQAVALHIRQARGKKPKPGSTITIVSIAGFNGT